MWLLKDWLIFRSVNYPKHTLQERNTVLIRNGDLRLVTFHYVTAKIFMRSLKRNSSNIEWRVYQHLTNPDGLYKSVVSSKGVFFCLSDITLIHWGWFRETESPQFGHIFLKKGEGQTSANWIHGVLEAKNFALGCICILFCHLECISFLSLSLRSIIVY